MEELAPSVVGKIRAAQNYKELHTVMVYGFMDRKDSSRHIDPKVLANYRIDCFAGRFEECFPRDIVYGRICNFNEATGQIDIEDRDKDMVLAFYSALKDKVDQFSPIGFYPAIQPCNAFGCTFFTPAIYDTTPIPQPQQILDAQLEYIRLPDHYYHNFRRAIARIGGKNWCYNYKCIN